MDGERFIGITRVISSRRSALAALAGLLPLALADAAAARTSKRKRRNKKRCKRLRVRFSCTGSCAAHKIDTCGRTVQCQCASGTTCQSNQSCGVSCATAPCPEGSGCTCSMTEPRLCLAPFTACERVLLPCESIDDCPPRTTCEETPCGEAGAMVKRCVQLCRL